MAIRVDPRGVEAEELRDLPRPLPGQHHVLLAPDLDGEQDLRAGARLAGSRRGPPDDHHRDVVAPAREVAVEDAGDEGGVPLREPGIVREVPATR